jgi:hypothetical protein
MSLLVYETEFNAASFAHSGQAERFSQFTPAFARVLLTGFKPGRLGVSGIQRASIGRVDKCDLARNPPGHLNACPNNLIVGVRGN